MDVLVQRMCFPTVSPGVFPAKDGGFAEAMALGDEEFEAYKLAFADLQRNVAQNPVAAEMVFTMLLEAVTGDLLRYPLERTVRKTRAESGLEGAMGRLYSVCGCL